MRIFLWIFALFALMTCEKEPSIIATDPPIIATDPPRISAVAEEIVLSRGRRAPEPLIFAITVPEGLASLAMTPVGGLSRIISRPTNGALSGQVKATFIAGDEMGEASLTLVVADQAGQMTSETASIEIVETDPPHVIAPQRAILATERYLRLSFPITTPGGFDSADIKDASGGIAEIVSHPGIDALSGMVEVDFIAGEEAGDGSVTLRINERTGQWISETASIEIVAIDLPSIIAPARVGALRGGFVYLTFTVTTPGGFGSAETKDVEGGISVIASEPTNGALSGVGEVLFRNVGINGGKVTLMIRDNTGYEVEANVEIHIAKPPSVITRGVLFPFVAGKTNTLQFTVNTSGGYARATVSDVELGTAWVSSEPENGDLSGVVEVTFVAGPVEGIEEFTIAVRDSLDQWGELSVSNDISLVRGVPLIPLITAPEGLMSTVDNIVGFKHILHQPEAYFWKAVISPGDSGTLVAIVSIPNGYASARISSHTGGMAKIISEPEPGALFGRVDVDFAARELKGTGKFTLEVIDELGEMADASVDIDISSLSITAPVDIKALKEKMRLIVLSISTIQGFASASVRESVGGNAEIISMPKNGAFDSAITVAFTAGSTLGAAGFTLVAENQMGTSISERVDVTIIDPVPPSIDLIKFPGIFNEEDGAFVMLANSEGNFIFNITAWDGSLASVRIKSSGLGGANLTSDGRRLKVVTINSGGTVGEGTFTLTATDNLGISKEITQKIKILRSRPAIIEPAEPISVSVVIGKTETLTFRASTPNGYHSARVSNNVGGVGRISYDSASRARIPRPSVELRVGFTAGHEVGDGSFALIVRDVLGRETSISVNVTIVEIFPPVITFGENLAVVKGSYQVFGIQIHAPGILESIEITNVVGGTARIWRAPYRVQFFPIDEVGEGSFTLTVIDQIGQSTTEVVNVSIVETLPISLTFFDSTDFDSNLRGKANLLSGNTKRFSLSFFIPGGYASYEITAVGGEAEVSRRPDLYSIGENIGEGTFIISFTAGDETGEGSFTLTVIDQSGQSKTITARIPIISDPLPISIIPRQEKFFIDPHLGAIARFAFDIITSNGFKRLERKRRSFNNLSFNNDSGLSSITIGSLSGVYELEVENGIDRAQGERIDLGLTLSDIAGQETDISIPLIAVSAPNVNPPSSSNLVVLEGEDRTFTFHVSSIPDGYASAVVSGEVGGTARISSEPPIGATKGNIEVTFSPSALGDGRFTLTVSGSEGREKKLDLNLEIIKVISVKRTSDTRDRFEDIPTFRKGKQEALRFDFVAPKGLAFAKVESVNGTAKARISLSPGEDFFEEIRYTGEDKRGVILVNFIGGSKGRIGSFTLTLRDVAGNQTSISESFFISFPISITHPLTTAVVNSGGSQELFVFGISIGEGFNFADIEEVRGGMAEIVSKPNPGDTSGQVTVLFTSGSEPGNGSILLRVGDRKDKVERRNVRIRIASFSANIKTKSIHPYENLVIEIQGNINRGFGSLLIRNPNLSERAGITDDIKSFHRAIVIPNRFITANLVNGKTIIVISSEAYHYPPSQQKKRVRYIQSSGYENNPFEAFVSVRNVSKLSLIRGKVLELWSDDYIENYRGVIGSFRVKHLGGPFDLTPTFDTNQVERLRRLDGGDDEALIGHAHIGLNNISADGSSAIIALLDTVIDTESPVYPFLSKDFRGINAAEIRLPLHLVDVDRKKQGNLYSHGERMSLNMLTIAPRVQIYNLGNHNYTEPHLNITPPPFGVDLFEILLSENVDIINSSGFFVGATLSSLLQKRFLDNDRIIVISLGNDTDQENGIEDKDSIITLPYDYSIRSGAFIVAQAVRGSPEFETHDTAQAGDCKYYTLTVPVVAFGGGSGTSAAASQLSAILALMIDINFEEFLRYTRRELVEILIQTADDIGEPGVDRIFGQGLVDVDEAVEFMRTRVKPTHRLYSELE